MPRFKIINSNSPIETKHPWVDAKKFDSKEKIVDANGKILQDPDHYQGRNIDSFQKKSVISLFRKGLAEDF
jgi:hypothetical protein